MTHLLKWQQQITDSLHLKLNKVNFDGLIMQLKQMFWKIISILLLFLSKTSVQQSYLKISRQLTHTELNFENEANGDNLKDVHQSKVVKV